MCPTSTAPSSRDSSDSWMTIFFQPPDVEFVSDVKVDVPINPELKVKIDLLWAPAVVKILNLTCIRVHARCESTHRYACTSLRSDSPLLSADLRGAHCLICPYHSSIVSEALGHRLNVII